MNIIKSSLVGAPVHGFFTRQGGVSRGHYESLNVGSGSGDNPEHVVENRKRASEALGFSSESLLTPYQLHSPRCVYVDGVIEPIEADAYVTDKAGLLLGVVTADCLPVLLWDSTGIIAAAHAGWKGALAGILGSVVDCMVGCGASVGDIRAVIGPAIGFGSYEVREDFRGVLCSADESYGDFFAVSGGGYRFDLCGFGEYLLRGLGVGEVEVLGEDTLSGDDRFFSYRRSCLSKEKDYGRQLSAIGIKE